MESGSRTEKLKQVTERLIIMTFLGLLIIGALFGYTLFYGQQLMISWICFCCGLIGGFVSIQQRIKKLTDEELELLSKSWFQVLLIPIYGGIFSLVLYIGFLSEVIKGPLFPHFVIPPFGDPPSREDVIRFLQKTYPTSGQEFAKLLFWSFVAGFSERFVPQLIDHSQTGVSDEPEAQ
ncbi:MAG: hypothetical protein HGB29_05210 [Chlorobiaceae bacterium]|nr:hypothetical protein [Chlorobiaceae bacterium]